MTRTSARYTGDRETLIEGGGDLHPGSRCAFCGRRTPGRLLCRYDFGPLAGACLGKRRHLPETAHGIERRTGNDAYPCPVCGWWHNGRDVNPARNDRILAIADAVRAVGGEVWLALLAIDWHPALTRREDWSGYRPPGRLQTTLAAADPDTARRLAVLGEHLTAQLATAPEDA